MAVLDRVSSAVADSPDGVSGSDCSLHRIARDQCRAGNWRRLHLGAQCLLPDKVSRVFKLGRSLDLVCCSPTSLCPSAAFQPFLGQLANAVGRRYVMMASIVLFLLGSAVAGSSASGKQLIAGRAMQGAGSGGVTMLVR